MDVRLNILGPEGRKRLLDRLEDLLDAVRAGPLLPLSPHTGRCPSDFTFFPVEQYEGAGWSASPSPPSLPCWTASMRAGSTWSGSNRGAGSDPLRDHRPGPYSPQACPPGAGAGRHTQDRERLRQLGDILTSNFYQMERGMARLHTVDFYDPEGREIDVPLDPLLTPSRMPPSTIRSTTRPRLAEVMLTQQLEKGRRELDYLNSVLDTIPWRRGKRTFRRSARSSPTLAISAAPPSPRAGEKRGSPNPWSSAPPPDFASPWARTIRRMTCSPASRPSRAIFGSIPRRSTAPMSSSGQRDRPPDLQSLNEAACLAAWFSQARSSSRVPVDYTPGQVCEKPNGARPGMVTYTTYETAWVTPRRIWSSDSRVR